ncbi:MAG: DNA polymerase III subunit delta [Kiloniella sp.]|nr:DNA polymerase III subunit delta [Kiloniella sp.]RZO32204.1 MAG: DNA polymerase III subunit delta [Rhodospirillaceae bacterium]
MKISSANADAFCRTAPQRARVVLIYGPDRGLVQERVKLVRAAVFGDDFDPMNHVRFTANEIEADPTRLVDEARALSLMGGPRLVEASGNDADLVRALTALQTDLDKLAAFVMIVADELSPRAKIRVMAEKSDGFAAVPCYSDEVSVLPTLIRQVLEEEHGLSVSADARQALQGHLGGDRVLTLNELQKLALYVGADAEEVTLEDVLACAPNAAGLELDRLLFAITAGRAAQVDTEFDRQLSAGTDPNAVLSMLRLHLNRFMAVGVAVDEGKTMQAAIAGLRPPLFFKTKDVFTAQARDWPLVRSLAALDLVRDCLAAVRQTDAPTIALTRQCLFDVARSGRPGR